MNKILEQKKIPGLSELDVKKFKSIVSNKFKLKSLVIPIGVTCYFRKYQIQVTGPQGTLYLDNFPLKKLEPLSNNLSTNRNPLIPTYHKLLSNAIIGVYYGYVLKLKVRGSGYKIINCINRVLTLRLGYSHLCRITIPEYIKVICNKFQQILCYSISKDKLTKFGDKIKRMRKRSPYRAKGVFEVSESIPNKTPGKTGKKK